jgi:hypothetical protein
MPETMRSTAGRFVPDPLDDVLRLVGEGRLTAAEAEPIIEALERVDARGGPGRSGPTSGGSGGRDDRRSPGRSIRLEVTEDGRTVVNLRLPASLGDAALRGLPGLSGSMVERIRQSIADGIRGTILETSDGEDGVRIAID